jgi:hypothetical protein
MEKRFSRKSQAGNREFKTARKKSLQHLHSLGMETGVTKTGVVGILKEKTRTI